MKESKLHNGKSECGSKFKTCLPVQWRKVQSCKKIENLFKSLLGRNLNPYASYLKRSSAGFTSIELIVVILCLAILAGTAVVSFRLNDEDKSTIAADQLIADIQYVQMRAMGIGNSQKIQFRFDASNYSTYRILDNADNPVETKKLPDGVTVDNNNFNNILKFNSLGEPFYDANNSCNVTNGCSITLRDGVTIMVYAVTGKTCHYDTINSRCF
jgi:type II secretory pathway pseudopilin PulG